MGMVIGTTSLIQAIVGKSKEDCLRSIFSSLTTITIFLLFFSLSFGGLTVGWFSVALADETSNSTTETGFTPSFFPVGVYIYGHKATIEALASKRNIDYKQWLDSAFGDLAARNCNSVYLANLSDNPGAFIEAVTIANQKGLSVFAQLTGTMYLRPSLGNDYYETTTLKAAQKIIPQYQGLSGVVAWMPKEEPTLADMPLLSTYREQVGKLDNKRALFTLHNTIEPFKQDKQNLPDWFGFDRYRFKSMFGDYGILLSTPKDMALRIREELAQFSSIASDKGRPLIFVMQGCATDWMGSKEDLLKTTSGVTPSASTGWQEIEGGKWFGWTKYAPPPFGMRLQCWLGILEGVKGLFVYKYVSEGQEVGKREVALVSEDGSPSAQWIEFGETISQIKPLFPLLLRWSKEAGSVLKSENPEVFISSFIDKTTMARYVVVVNARIAEWDQNSPRFLGSTTELKFDINGLQGLRPASDLKANLTIDGNFTLRDYLTGEQLSTTQDNSLELTLPPGGGKVLVIQSASSIESPQKFRILDQ